MIFAKSYSDSGIYMTVRQVLPSDHFTDVRVYTSEKDRNDPDKKIYSNWMVRLVGAAHAKADTIVPGDTIILKEFRMSNPSYVSQSGTYTSYLRLLAWDFDIRKGDPNHKSTYKNTRFAKNASKKEDKKTYKKEPEPAPASEPDEEMPF